MASLAALPPPVIQRLVDLDSDLLPLFLHRLGSRSLFESTRHAIYGTLIVTDASLSSYENVKVLIAFEHRGYAACVRRVVVRPPGVCIYDSPTAEGLRLLDEDLFELLARLPSLETLEWRSDRLPPVDLCTVVGATSAHSLKEMIFSLADREAGRVRQRSISGALVVEGEDEYEESTLDLAQGPLRWDAPNLCAIKTSTLRRLFFSELTATGSKILVAALSEANWPSLSDIELRRTMFVDDSVMRAIVQGAKGIRRIAVSEMHGTKLTEKGIAALAEGLMHLRELEIIDVEGRLSKTGWLQLDMLPSSLRSIRFAYREERQYHSWSLDHPENVLSLLSLSPELQRLSISRIVPCAALVPGRHNRFPHLATNIRTAPKAITREQLETICGDGKGLKELDLDWWSMSCEVLETIVRKLPSLEKLKVMLNAPMPRLASLGVNLQRSPEADHSTSTQITSGAFSNSKLKKLVISIPPEHTPQLAVFDSPAASPMFELRAAPPSPNTHRAAATPPSPRTGLAPADPKASPILLRDMRKFAKKASQLQEVVWTGRGGLGEWRFERTGLTARADFTPVLELLPPTAFVEGGIGTFPAPDGVQRPTYSPAGSPFASSGTKRRSQSIASSSVYSNTGSSDRSRRSSAASTTASSWVGPAGQNIFGLEGIPGTPTTDEPDSVADFGVSLAEGLAKSRLGGSPRKGKGRRASLKAAP